MKAIILPKKRFFIVSNGKKIDLDTPEGGRLISEFVTRANKLREQRKKVNHSGE